MGLIKREHFGLFSDRSMEGIDILRQIGKGSYGSVWLARRQSDDRNLVLKSVNLSHLTSEQEESARQDVHILAGLKHPHIVSYKNVRHHISCRQNGFCPQTSVPKCAKPTFLYYSDLLMTYCEGGDLFTKIQHQNIALFPEQQIVRCLIKITMALQVRFLANYETNCLRLVFHYCASQTYVSSNK
ncbi:hypothetical protein SK128_002810 [Halocaridina rubra]|uniref:non-specific serine/threonine protein kinase n=1 Tax=Halocaridina rubra TaxID=373956 RepID=A0AAN8XUS5_HALRR